MWEHRLTLSATHPTPTSLIPLPSVDVCFWKQRPEGAAGKEEQRLLLAGREEKKWEEK